MNDSRPPTMRIVDNADANRYEAYVDGELAGIAEYIRTKNLIAFVHTEVEGAYEGQGIGGALVRTSLDAARAAEAPVLAVCPFYTGWITRHPEYRALVYTNRSRVSD
ncbi:GNAT family N-acetyltransferase [Streptosporangium sp. G11]|uniref:GNAT family N-acetyltransferase n=1 Tax=Streptosporangium sp. G11 TaxID=3436926 RepID=UPI003EBA1BA9